MRIVTSKQKAMSCTLIAGLLISMVFFIGCATPVGVTKLDPKTVQRTLTSNVLTTGKLSAPSVQVLNRFGLLDRTGSLRWLRLLSCMPAAAKTARIFSRQHAMHMPFSSLKIKALLPAVLTRAIARQLTCTTGALPRG
jgi:hypothetical protein